MGLGEDAIRCVLIVLLEGGVLPLGVMGIMNVKTFHDILVWDRFNRGVCEDGDGWNVREIDGMCLFWIIGLECIRCNDRS